MSKPDNKKNANGQEWIFKMNPPADSPLGKDDNPYLAQIINEDSCKAFEQYLRYLRKLEAHERALDKAKQLLDEANEELAEALRHNLPAGDDAFHAFAGEPVGFLLEIGGESRYFELETDPTEEEFLQVKDCYKLNHFKL